MIEIGVGSILLAIWLITLFLEKSIGLSMLLFTVPITLFIIYILQKNNKIKNPKAKILLVPIVLLSSIYFIFNNAFFNNLNILVIPVLIIFMILGLFNEKFELNLEIVKKVLGIIFTPLSYIGEGIEKLTSLIEEKFKIALDSRKERKIKKIIKTIFIIVPIVTVIIILLSTADEIFASIFFDLFEDVLRFIREINISVTFVKIVLIILAFLYFIGFFYYINYKFEPDEKQEKQVKKDNFTIKVLLFILNIIYLIFCYIQIKSLFLRDTSLNYANYARQGFFQLMLVSVINLITIVIAKKSENTDEIKSNKYINFMCLIMIVFTFIIVISAAFRMYLYESAYGYTLLRLLVYVSLFTETILFIPTILYIIDKKIDLPKTYFAIIITVYVFINFANFDNIIVKRNVDRYIETGVIDLEYIKSETGTDAVNQLIRLLEEEPKVENKVNYIEPELNQYYFEEDLENMYDVKEETQSYLKQLYRKLSYEQTDFINLNISKITAQNLIEDNLK